MENYSVIERIGEGAHGQVLKGIHLKTAKEVAMKKVLVKKFDKEIPISTLREIKTLLQVDCRYVMRLLDYFSYGMCFILVFDYMPSGLWEVITDLENPVTESQIKSYMQMLLIGLDYLHNHNLLHRDLKPANLLISYSGELQIADLGLARVMCSERPYTHQVATRWYRAPELLYGARNYTNSVDLWAAACILAEFYNKSPLFPGENDIEQLSIVIKGLGTPNWKGITLLPDYNKISFPTAKPQPWETLLPDVDSSAIQIISSILIYNPQFRLTASQALNHIYFLTIPLPCPLTAMPRPIRSHQQKAESILIKKKTSSEIFNNLNLLINGK